MLEPEEKVIVALDCSHEQALALADKLASHARWVKVGMTLFYAYGPSVVKEMHDRGLKVFLDLKLHDIPHQILGAAESASLSGADILSIHGCGGKEMISAARKGAEAAAASRDGKRTQLVAITVLTSMDSSSLQEVGVKDSMDEQVKRLASLAYDNGADGCVCSPQEAAAMRNLLGKDALIVCPGVRPAGSEVGDQKRIATPAKAIQAGASMLVVGRPITQAQDPVAAFDAIVDEIRTP